MISFPIKNKHTNKTQKKECAHLYHTFTRREAQENPIAFLLFSETSGIALA